MLAIDEKHEVAMEALRRGLELQRKQTEEQLNVDLKAAKEDAKVAKAAVDAMASAPKGVEIQRHEELIQQAMANGYNHAKQVLTELYQARCSKLGRDRCADAGKLQSKAAKLKKLKMDLKQTPKKQELAKARGWLAGPGRQIRNLKQENAEVERLSAKAHPPPPATPTQDSTPMSTISDQKAKLEEVETDLLKARAELKNKELEIRRIEIEHLSKKVTETTPQPVSESIEIRIRDIKIRALEQEVETLKKEREKGTPSFELEQRARDLRETKRRLEEQLEKTSKERDMARKAKADLEKEANRATERLKEANDMLEQDSEDIRLQVPDQAVEPCSPHQIDKLKDEKSAPESEIEELKGNHVGLRTQHESTETRLMSVDPPCSSAFATVAKPEKTPNAAFVNGEIIVLEKNFKAGGEASNLFNKWRSVGTLTQEEFIDLYKMAYWPARNIGRVKKEARRLFKRHTWPETVTQMLDHLHGTAAQPLSGGDLQLENELNLLLKMYQRVKDLERDS